MRVGIIDVGTNSIHLLIAQRRPNGSWRALRTHHALARLGDGGLRRRRLTAAAMRRALIVLTRYRRLLRRVHADRIEAVATSAVRDAENGAAFVRQVRTRCGFPLRIVSGREEARLIYQGVAGLNRLRRATLVLTIGGGSAQVAIGTGGQVRYARSIPLGSARLAQRFIHHDPALPQELDRLRRYVARRWAPVMRAIRRVRWRRAVGSSAMIAQVMHAARGRRRSVSVTPPALRRLILRLSASTAHKRRRLPGIDARRQELLLPTSVALLAWMDAGRGRSLRFAPGSLREGLLMAYNSRRR